MTETWEMVVIGDSFTSMSSWPQMYASAIEEEFGVEVEILDYSIPGDPDILGLVTSRDSLRNALSEAEAIAVQADVGPPTDRAEAKWFSGACGGEDGLDCFREEVDTFRTEWQSIVDEVVSLRSPENAIIRTFQWGTWVYDNYYGSNFRGTRDWEVVVAGMIMVNDVIAQVAEAADIPVIDVNAAFSGHDYHQPLPDDFTSDGFHPSKRGSEVITELLIDSGWQPFRP